MMRSPSYLRTRVWGPIAPFTRTLKSHLHYFHSPISPLSPPLSPEKLEKEKDDAKKEEWIEYWDDAAQAYYYFNPVTQEANWTKPDGFMGDDGDEDILFEGDEDATDYDTAGEIFTLFSLSLLLPCLHQI